MILQNSIDARIDRAILYGFRVVKILNYEKLIHDDILTIKKNGANPIKVDNICFNSIKISDDENFKSFTYATKSGKEYGRLELIIPNDDGYYNLNCHSPEQLRLHVKDVVAHLRFKYGIVIDISEIKIKEIEINKTIPIEYEFQDYSRVLNLMMFATSGRLRCKTAANFRSNDVHCKRAIDCRIQDHTYVKTSGAKGLTIKIYDKSAELHEKYKVDVSENYLRYEVTLHDSTKIKRKLGSNLLSELTQERLNNYYHEFLTSNVDAAFRSFSQKRHDDIVRIMRNSYIPGDKLWIRKTLTEFAEHELESNGLPLLLDIKELKCLLKEVGFKNRNAMNQAWRTFNKLALECNQVFTHDDDQKYEELIRKLMWSLLAIGSPQAEDGSLISAKAA